MSLPFDPDDDHPSARLDDPDNLDLPPIDSDPAPRGSKGMVSAGQQNRETPVGWKPTMAEPIPVVRCHGTVRTGPNAGQRCTKWSLRGATRCLSHGGQLPNVQEAARKRVEAARLRLIDDADLAIDTLFELLQTGTADQVRLGAAKEILDRANVKGTVDFHVEVEHKVSPADAIRDRLANIAKRVENPVDIGEITGSESSPEDEDASDTDD